MCLFWPRGDPGQKRLCRASSGLPAAVILRPGAGVRTGCRFVVVVLIRGVAGGWYASQFSVLLRYVGLES